MTDIFATLARLLRQHAEFSSVTFLTPHDLARMLESALAQHAGDREAGDSAETCPAPGCKLAMLHWHGPHVERRNAPASAETFSDADVERRIREAIAAAFADTFRTANRINQERSCVGMPEPFVASDPTCAATRAIMSILAERHAVARPDAPDDLGGATWDADYFGSERLRLNGVIIAWAYKNGGWSVYRLDNEMQFKSGQAADLPSAKRAAAAELRRAGVLPTRPDAPPASRGTGEKPSFDLIAHLYRQRTFSERTFGPGARTAGVLDHIRKELREIENDPADITEWIDVVLLALDGAWRAGHPPEQIAAALDAKQTKNESRTWPDWRTAAPGKAIEHDRSGASPTRPEAPPASSTAAQLKADRHARRPPSWPTHLIATTKHRDGRCVYEAHCGSSLNCPASLDIENTGFTRDPLKVRGCPACVERARGTGERPMLTEWRNCGDGVLRERLRDDGGKGSVRAAVNAAFIVTPDGEQIEIDVPIGSNAERIADAAAPQWYTLPASPAPKPEPVGWDTQSPLDAFNELVRVYGVSDEDAYPIRAALTPCPPTTFDPNALDAPAPTAASGEAPRRADEPESVFDSPPDCADGTCHQCRRCYLEYVAAKMAGELDAPQSPPARTDAQTDTPATGDGDVGEVLAAKPYTPEEIAGMRAGLERTGDSRARLLATLDLVAGLRDGLRMDVDLLTRDLDALRSREDMWKRDAANDPRPAAMCRTGGCKSKPDSDGQCWTCPACDAKYRASLDALMADHGKALSDLARIRAAVKPTDGETEVAAVERMANNFAIACNALDDAGQAALHRVRAELAARATEGGLREAVGQFIAAHDRNATHSGATTTYRANTDDEALDRAEMKAIAALRTALHTALVAPAEAAREESPPAAEVKP